MKKCGGKLVLIGMIILLMCGLAGCKKATPENLLASMAEKTAEFDSFATNLKMEMQATFGYEGFSADMMVQIEMDSEETTDPITAYTETKMEVAVMGEKETGAAETYVEEEDGKYNVYSKSDVDDDWYMTEMTDEYSANLDLDVLKPEYFELNEELETIDGEECFVLSGTLQGEELEELLNAAINMMDEEDSYFDSFLDEDVFGEDIEIPIEIYIARKTQYPLKMTMDMCEMMQNAFDSQGLGGECETFYCEIVYSSFNEISEIAIPDDVRDSATAEESDDEEKDLEASDEVLEGIKQESELGEKWDSMTMSIDGNVLTLPCTFEQLTDAGLTMDDFEFDEDTVIDVGEEELAYFRAPGATDGDILVGLYNDSSKPVSMENALVVDIEFYDSDVEDLKVLFPGNLEIGMKAEAFKEAYGEPVSYYEGSYMWRAEKGEFDQVFEIHYDEETNEVTYADMYVRY